MSTILKFGSPVIVFPLVLAALLSIGCRSSSSEFETFMGTPLPSTVKVTKMDGNWGTIHGAAGSLLQWTRT